MDYRSRTLRSRLDYRRGVLSNNRSLLFLMAAQLLHPGIHRGATTQTYTDDESKEYEPK